MNEIQKMLEESVTRLFSEHVDRTFLAKVEDQGWPAALWDLVNEQGLTQVLTSEASGGMGAGFADAFVVVRACGRHAVPLPVAEQMLALWLLEQSGVAAPKGVIALLPAVLPTTERFTLEVPRVPWGRNACHFVGFTEAGELVLFDAVSATLVNSQNLAREPRDTVKLNNAAPVARAATSFKPDVIRWLGALLRAAQIAGAAAACLEMSVKYTSEREQFGRALSQFQLIQSHLAEIAGAMASVDTMAHTAFIATDARGIARDVNAGFEIAAAKCRASDAVELLTRLAHQVHGAIGFTYEYDLQFLTRRLWSWRAEFGAGGDWGEILGRTATATGGDQLWALVTK